MEATLPTSRLLRWLQSFSIDKDPFAVWQADQEGPWLNKLFVHRPYIWDILGDPAHPQTAFLMANRGCGKTATREMVAYECQHASFKGRALAVRYYDFSRILKQVDGDPSRLTARHHARAIARQTLKTLADDVPPLYFDLLNDMDRGLLLGYAAALADSSSQLKLRQLMHAQAGPLDLDDLSPVEIMEMLARLVTQLGPDSDKRYEALYILLDRVDESSAGPDAAVPLLKPLVREGPLLQMPHVAFKLFLPIEVWEQLRRVVGLRQDKLISQTITWDPESLQRMMEERLAYSSNGRVRHIEDLCTTSAKAGLMERLIAACDNSPRTLLRLCQALIHRHVSQTDKPLIDRPEIAAILLRFAQEGELEMAPSGKIFLSYGSEDRAIVEAIYERLGQSGYKPWMDTKDILPGEHWQTAIDRAIRQSDVFIACVSQHSTTKRGVLQKEIRQALDSWQGMLRRDIYLIPLRLDTCDVPEELRQFQWLDWHADAEDLLVHLESAKGELEITPSVKIFLSYAREDGAIVEAIYERLGQSGYKPWMDMKDILPGELWETAIDRAIRESDFVIACVSKHSTTKRGVLQKEIRRALNIREEMLREDIYLIPLRLDTCDVPEELRQSQWLDWQADSNDWLVRLKRAIREGMKRRDKASGD